MTEKVDFETLVAQRRSTRGYMPDPVPQSLMEEIIDIAKRAPSSMNTQPWHFHAVTGEPLERIREGNTELMLAGADVDREIKMSGHGYQGVHRNRQVEIAIQLFEAMGIERDDKERRQDDHANIPDDQVIMTCVAMGYPNPEFVANDVVSRRSPTEDVVSFVGFDQ
jgi:hypothetical protein